jgi:hypothetical protein
VVSHNPIFTGGGVAVCALAAAAAQNISRQLWSRVRNIGISPGGMPQQADRSRLYHIATRTIE